jgi:hypothetical protein
MLKILAINTLIAGLFALLAALGGGGARWPRPSWSA